MSDEAKAATLEELSRTVPYGLCASWPTQWAEDGREIGHHHAPVGQYIHALRAQVEALTAEKEEALKANELGLQAIKAAQLNAEIYERRWLDALKNQEKAERERNEARAELARVLGLVRRVLTRTPHSMCCDADAWALLESAVLAGQATQG